MSDEITLRDTFAAAALTGLLADGEWPADCEVAAAEEAYRHADAMLRERGTAVRDNCFTGNQREMECPVTEPMPKEKRSEVSGGIPKNHDAAPAARADLPDERSPNAVSANGGTTGAASRDGSGTGNTLSRAEIDALQHVVEDGKIVDMSDYGYLRSLLVRLRPEWEGEDEFDRSEPISAERLAALERLSALDQELERTHGVLDTRPEGTVQDEDSFRDSRNAKELMLTADERRALEYARNACFVVANSMKPLDGGKSEETAKAITGLLNRHDRVVCDTKTDPTPPRNGAPTEGSVPDSRSENEPVAWWLKGTECDTGCEYEYVSLVKESADAAAAEGGTVTPLYVHPAEPCPYVTGKTTRYCTLTPFTLSDDEQVALRAVVRYIERASTTESLRLLRQAYSPLRGLLERAGGDK